ncbi:tRNA pseudouridine(13) synthase TruD [Xenorhabdus bovienii]|uniref:tRNA pseudouridine(13) synthase TruD n=1 Tax=Xenorhabdus bovienii TaxID=40576 RepID=UPI0023B2C7F4|nr:tRNA pseudouridine(13) synthase TruD [Xenorhabdus bovienii]MDE9541062.1 tRNA pseudouridine(13) synthase TruD [Xenorhabdus bovienii]
MIIVFKSKPEDFRVKEVPYLINSTLTGNGAHQYFVVHKKNHETFDVVSVLSSYFNIKKEYINFSGLKDKDGITEQLVSIKKTDDNQLSTAGFNDRYYKSEEEEKYIYLTNTGITGDALSIASLHGNTFDIVVRSIEETTSKKFFGKETINFSFINYYDTQRFGVPGKEKKTHKIGEALINEKYDLAIEMINDLEDGEEFKNNPVKNREDLYERIDKRKLAFYLSSYSSYEWNIALQKMIARKIDNDKLIYDQVDDIPYIYLRDSKDLFSLINEDIDYKYKRYIIKNGEIEGTEINRPVIIQVFIRCSEPEVDELYNGKYKCRFRFYLPSGGYATMAIRQLLQRVHF